MSHLSAEDVLARCLYVVLQRLPDSKSTRRLIIAMMAAAQTDVAHVTPFLSDNDASRLQEIERTYMANREWTD
jgi:hypothetical protein